MNIYEIAQKADVSTATVSRVINNSSKVSEKTRAKITKLMEEENYLPSAFARGLSGTSAKSIGILTIDIRDQYYASVIHSLEQELSLSKYNVILCNTGGESDIQRNYISLLLQKKIDVLILVGSVFKNEKLKEIIDLVSKKIPVIIVNENVDGENIYSLICEESKGMNNLILYLKSLNHKNFVYIKSSNSFSAKRKLSGFKLSLHNQPIFEVSKEKGDAKIVVNNILKLKIKPTAIICDEDLTALWIIQELTFRGFNVPKDFSVTGFNNLTYSLCSNPPMTTVDNKSSTMGLTAAKIALNILDLKNVPNVTKLSTELIIRSTTSSVI